MERALMLIGWAAAAMAAPVKLPIVADTNVSSYQSELEYTYGARSAARVKGIEMFYLAMPDLKPLSGQRVTAARFYLKPVRAHQFHHVGFSTVAAVWAEDQGTGEQDPGGTSFVRRMLPGGGTAPWGLPDGDFTDVAFCAGQTIVSYDQVRPEADGWLSTAVDPAILAAIASGESAGFCFSDESGQSRANNDIFCREQSNAAPYLLVEVQPAPEPRAELSGVTVTPAPEAATLAGGAARVSFSLTASAADLPWLRLDLIVNGTVWPRYLTPRPKVGVNEVVLDKLPAGPVEVKVATGGQSAVARGATSPALQPLDIPSVEPQRTKAPADIIFAVPDYVSVHPASGNVLEEVGSERYGGPPTGQYQFANPVWDANGIHLAGARGETVGCQVIGGPVVYQAGLTMDGIDLDPEWSVIWYVPDPQPVGEYAVPMQYAAKAVQNGQERVWFASLLELPIPVDAQPGEYRGTVRAGRISVPLRLTVWKHQLPDQLGFDVSLNSYGAVNGMYGIRDLLSDEALAIERDYHRLAHAHRLTWAPLGYGQSGKVEPGAAPVLAGEGGATTCDFADYDRRFGPLLDGSAFAGLPRDGVPIDHVYLPFHENWPGSMESYGWQPTTADYPSMIAAHAAAPPIAEAFPAAYQERFRTVARQFAEHVKAEGWTRTELQVYFNDKYNFKDPKQGGRGTSWWLLDEPMHRDDWLALRFFAGLLKEAVPDRTLQVRADISRPQWQRDWLDGLVDLDVVGNAYYHYRDRTSAWLRSQDAVAWTYGSANAVGQPNTQAVAWCLKAYLAGADGVVPWNSIGGDGSFEQPSQTALIVPGTRFGFNGPVASLRLKALRAGQQEVERLRLLAAQSGVTREQLGAGLAQMLDLSSAAQSKGGEDAGWLAFGSVSPDAVDRVKMAVAAKLEQG